LILIIKYDWMITSQLVQRMFPFLKSAAASVNWIRMHVLHNGAIIISARTEKVKCNNKSLLPLVLGTFSQRTHNNESFLSPIANCEFNKRCFLLYTLLNLFDSYTTQMNFFWQISFDNVQSAPFSFSLFNHLPRKP